MIRVNSGTELKFFNATSVKICVPPSRLELVEGLLKPLGAGLGRSCLFSHGSLWSLRFPCSLRHQDPPHLGSVIMIQQRGEQHATISVLAVGLDVHIVLHATGGMLPGCVIRWLLKVLGYGQMALHLLRTSVRRQRNLRCLLLVLLLSRCQAVGAPQIDVEQPAHSGVPPSVGLPVPQASQAARSTLDDAAGVAARDPHVGEVPTGAGGSHDVPRQSLLKRPFPGSSEPSSPAMRAQSSASAPPTPPVGTQGLKRSAEVELVDLEQEIEQTGPPRPRMLENLFWCSDVSSGVCMSEHVTRPEIHDETVCSIKFSDGRSVKGGSERKKLGGSDVLVWKPQGGVDDSTFEELPGDQVFAGMSGCVKKLLIWRSAKLGKSLVMMRCSVSKNNIQRCG